MMNPLLSSLASLPQHETPVALITGGARRIGAAISQYLHQHHYRVLIHYRQSATDARALVDHLNRQRPDSAALVQADLDRDDAIAPLVDRAISCFGRVDVLINNASAFYPTPVGEATPEHWDELMNSNAKAPFFLSQALAAELRQRRGCIINIADIHARQPLPHYTLYCMAKAANTMLTQSLARELAPQVRVNSVAPGAILWPEHEAELSAADKQAMLRRIPLEKLGAADNIAQAVFMLLHNDYITGQIVAVDGGRLLD